MVVLSRLVRLQSRCFEPIIGITDLCTPTPGDDSRSSARTSRGRNIPNPPFARKYCVSVYWTGNVCELQNGSVKDFELYLTSRNEPACPIYTNQDETYQADTCQPLLQAAARERSGSRPWSTAIIPGGRCRVRPCPGSRPSATGTPNEPQTWGLAWHQNEGIELTLLERGSLRICRRGEGVPAEAERSDGHSALATPSTGFAPHRTRPSSLGDPGRRCSPSAPDVAMAVVGHAGQGGSGRTDPHSPAQRAAGLAQRRVRSASVLFESPR